MSKIKDGVIGHAIGDAIGVPVEFRSRTYLDRNPVRGMIGNGVHNQPIGTWSDDTSLEVCLMESICDKGVIDYTDIMSKFTEWLYYNKYTATDKTFDCGITTRLAINKWLEGNRPFNCGGSDINSNGNGSLMRILPVAFIVNTLDLDSTDTYKLVLNVSSLTHSHEISVLGCYIYVNYINFILKGLTKEEAYYSIQNIDYSFFSKDALKEYSRILNKSIDKCSRLFIKSTGYVVHSLEATLWCILNNDDYSDTVLKAVNLGDDTDTIGAITGSIAGILYGMNNIPIGWRHSLKKRKYLENLSDRFESTIKTLKK